MRIASGVIATLVAPAALAVAITLAPGAAPAAAQEVASAAAAPEERPAPKRMTASRVSGALELDGVLDDEAWRGAAFESGFRQKGKDRDYEPWATTHVAFLYDDEALWVAARMQRDERGGATPALGRRDDPGNADRVVVSFDTFRDRTTAYSFGVTASGVRIDYVSSRDMENWADASYDPLWEARVAADSTGWTAEMRIPFSQLRFSPGEQQVWGLNVRRWHPATYLDAYWIAIPYYQTGWASRFGELHGLSGVDGGAGIELKPYALGQATVDGTLPGSPTETRTRYGGDLKAGLGSSLTLDATVRPDFGQVEADPARVNLGQFETYFPERRPFFTEGTELFRTRGPNWFYSRRIGSAPPGVLPDNLFERVQDATVLGGGKITGRLPSGTSVGVLGALTDREEVQLAGERAGQTRSVVAAPRTAFGVARLRQELGTAGSNLGFIVTGVGRTLGADATLRSVLPERAVTAGADWTVRFDEGAYELTGYAGGSRVSGDPAAIRWLQRSSAHYYQRPDAEHVGLDSLATSLSGWAGGIGIGKIGRHQWTWNVAVDALSPGLDVRDAGSQTRSDRVDAQASVTRTVRDEDGAVRDRRFGLGAASGWNFGGVRRHTSLSASAAVTWGNLWTTSLDGGVGLRATSDDLTRGGPLMQTPRMGWVDFGLWSRPTADGSWNLEASSYFDEFGGWSATVGAGYRLQAARWLELDFQTGITRADDSRQFVWIEWSGRPATYDYRWVFSSLEREELYARIRAKIAFAPDAVLTLYAEPFVSSGRFHDFGELAEAGGSALRRYGEGRISIERLDDGSWWVAEGEKQFWMPNYDFWVRSFRSTSVFQWEWRQGSTLYLIWQRSLWAWADRPGPVAGDQFWSSLRDPGSNTFVVKASMLLGLG